MHAILELVGTCKMENKTGRDLKLGKFQLNLNMWLTVKRQEFMTEAGCLT